MHKALHPKDDTDRQYVSRKEEGRGLTSINDSINALIQRLEEYIKKDRKRLITATRNNIENKTNKQTKKQQKTKMGRKTTI